MLQSSSVAYKNSVNKPTQHLSSITGSSVLESSIFLKTLDDSDDIIVCTLSGAEDDIGLGCTEGCRR